MNCAITSLLPRIIIFSSAPKSSSTYIVPHKIPFFSFWLPFVLELVQTSGHLLKEHTQSPSFLKKTLRKVWSIHKPCQNRIPPIQYADSSATCYPTDRLMPKCLSLNSQFFTVESEMASILARIPSKLMRGRFYEMTWNAIMAACSLEFTASAMGCQGQ